jgi:sodium/bile acid cotransporter 7
MLGAVSAENVLDDESKQRRVAEMYAEYKKSFPEISDLSPDQVFKLMKRVDVVFVDVRDSEEQTVSMIPGALTHGKFLEDPDSYKERTVIAYCTISYRSGKFVSKLRKRGIHVINLQQTTETGHPCDQSAGRPAGLAPCRRSGAPGRDSRT